MIRVASRVLDIPAVFELQQRLFNDYEKVATEFSEFLDRPSLDILDVWCSTGTCAGAVVDMKRHRYTGIDVVPAYVQAASRRHPDGRFLATDARHLEFADAGFDLALYIGVLHHMDDETARACLKETRRVVRPAGRILIAEPVFTAGRWLSSMLLSVDRGRHIRDEAGYRALFGDCGVERERHFRLSFHRFCSFVLVP